MKIEPDTILTTCAFLIAVALVGGFAGVEGLMIGAYGMVTVVVLVGMWHELRNAQRSKRAAEKNHRMGRYSD